MYGVDLDSNEPVTPLMVRDAMSLCFYVAHCQDVDLGAEKVDETINREYCRNTVKKAFEDSGGDFKHPTKESILEAMKKLAEFAKSFRDPTIIQRHSREIMQLVERIKPFDETSFDGAQGKQDKPFDETQGK